MPIFLADGREVQVDEEDVERLSQHKWSAYYTKSSGPYAHARVNGKLVSMHRFLMGEPPGLVDHKDGEGLNNRKANLRAATNSQNAANMRIGKRNKSGVKGVHWAAKRQKWNAQIKVNYRSVNLGFFSDIADAEAAYKDAAEKHFGEFARTERRAS